MLAAAVEAHTPESPVVLALPRGGVPVGYEVAITLDCPLDVLVVRKIGLPGHQELAIGAVAEGGVSIRNDRVIAMAGVSEEQFSMAERRAEAELVERVARYRGGRAATSVEDRTAVIVDDGLATGSTARAAIELVRRRSPGAVWLGAPVAPRDTISSFEGIADRVVVLEAPRRFIAVGNWYRDFTQTTDAEVRRLLDDRGGWELP